MSTFLNLSFSCMIKLVRKIMLPFKKRAQFLCSNDSSQSGYYPDASFDDRVNSSTSNLMEAGDENKSDTLIPMEFEKISSCTTYDKDAMRSSLGSQDDDFAISEEKQEYETTEVIDYDGDGGVSKDGAHDIVSDGTKAVMEHDGGGDGNHGVSGSRVLCDGTQIHQTKKVIEYSGSGDGKQSKEPKEPIEHESAGDWNIRSHVIRVDDGDESNSNSAPRREDQVVSIMEDKGDCYCISNDPDHVVEHGKQMHHDEPVAKIEGSNTHIRAATTLVESIVEHGKQMHHDEPVAKINTHIRAATTLVESMNEEDRESDHQEGHVDAMKDSYYEVIASTKPHDGDCNAPNIIDDGKQVKRLDLVTTVEGNNSHGSIVGEEETNQGKILEDDVVSIIGCDDDSGGNEMTPKGGRDHNRNATDIVVDGEQMHKADLVTNLTISNSHSSAEITLIKLKRDEKREEQGKRTSIEEEGDGITAPIAEYQDQKGKKRMEYVVCAKVHDDSIQQPAFEVSDGGSSAVSPGGHTPIGIQGGKEIQFQQDPLTLTYFRKRQSIQELGNLSQDGGSSNARGPEARKKTKVGRDEIGGSSSVDGGVGSNDPSVQQAKNTFKLFGVDIPFEEEHEEPVIHQPTRWLKLLGVDIIGPQQELQKATAGSGNRSSLTNQGSAGHGSSLHTPKLGLRLMGFDL